MSSCKDIQALLMDWLYDELAPDERARFEGHVEGCASCGAEVASVLRVRETLRELPEEEPPAGLSAILLAEAGKRAPGAAGSVGLWAWLAGVFRPVMAHPALAAVASLMLVVSVGGAMYLRGESPYQDHSRAHTAAASEVPAADSEMDGRRLLASELARDEASPAHEPVAATPAQEEEDADGEVPRQGAVARADMDALAFRGAGLEELGGARLESESKRSRTRRSASSGAGRFADSSAAGSSTARSPARSRPASRSAKLDADKAPGEQAMAGRPEPSKQPSADEARPFAGEGAAGLATDGRARGPASGRTWAQPPPPPAVAAAPAARDSASAGDADDTAQGAGGVAQGGGARDARARAQHDRLRQAARASRCGEVARLANDIREQSPAYYQRHVGRSQELGACNAQVAEEQRRRASRKSGAAVPADRPARATEPAASPE